MYKDITINLLFNSFIGMFLSSGFLSSLFSYRGNTRNCISTETSYLLLAAALVQPLQLDDLGHKAILSGVLVEFRRFLFSMGRVLHLLFWDMMSLYRLLYANMRMSGRMTDELEHICKLLW
jgi:ABC-type Fe3+-siderophore transport system permease subunit